MKDRYEIKIALCTFIIYQTIAPWYGKSEPAAVNIVGLSETDVAVKRKITAHIQPWWSDEISLQVTLWILPKTNNWEPIYPETAITCDTLERPLQQPLADPLFWQPSKLQILLGIDVLTMLMMECKSHCISSRILSQETAMGHMLFGSTSG